MPPGTVETIGLYWVCGVDGKVLERTPTAGAVLSYTLASARPTLPTLKATLYPPLPA